MPGVIILRYCLTTWGEIALRTQVLWRSSLRSISCQLPSWSTDANQVKWKMTQGQMQGYRGEGGNNYHPPGIVQKSLNFFSLQSDLYLNTYSFHSCFELLVVSEEQDHLWYLISSYFRTLTNLINLLLADKGKYFLSSWKLFLARIFSAPSSFLWGRIICC